MFDLFRSRETSVRILLGVLLGLVALSMLIYLVPGGGGGGSSFGQSNQNVIATVGGEQITATDVQRALENMTRGQQQQLPKAILAMYLPTIVNQMIEEKAMAYKAREMGLRVSDQELGDSIQAELSPMMGGKFDMNLYQRVLAQQGMTTADFENNRRDAMLGLRLQNLQAQSLIVTDQEARAEYQRKNLKVGLEYLQFQDKDFVSKVSKDPAAIKAYFDKNRAQFRIPEKRNFGLIAGTAADFVQNAKVDDAALQKEYQENLDTYRLPERVLVRHILIKTQGLPKDQEPKLKAKAENILTQLQHGGNFAELAKQNSDDPGSKDKGGELGWIVRGQTVPNFEKAAFSLQPGQLSGLVQTEFGYHIIQVQQKQLAHTQTFEEVKPQILAELQKQQGEDNLKKAIDAAHRDILRAPAQAEAIAKEHNLKFFKLTNFGRSESMPEVNTQAEVTNAVFSAPKNGVTDVIELANQGKQVFAVITDIIPARNAEYAEVQNEVVQSFTAAESSRLAAEAAQRAAERARKGESLAAIGKTYGVALKTAAPFTIDGAAEGIGAASLVSAAFKGNVGDVVGPISAQSSQFVARVSEKTPADMNQFAKNKDALVQNLGQERQNVQGPLFRASIVDELKRRGKIRINQKALDSLMGDFQRS